MSSTVTTVDDCPQCGIESCYTHLDIRTGEERQECVACGYSSALTLSESGTPGRKENLGLGVLWEDVFICSHAEGVTEASLLARIAELESAGHSVPVATIADGPNVKFLRGSVGDVIPFPFGVAELEEIELEQMEVV